MKMRHVLFVAATSGLLMSSPALAFENFIPMGTGYSTEVGSLPSFDSEEGQISQQADVYESEIYRKSLNDAQTDSNLRQFFANRDAVGSDGFIDY